MGLLVPTVAVGTFLGLSVTDTAAITPPQKATAAGGSMRSSEPARTTTPVKNRPPAPVPATNRAPLRATRTWTDGATFGQWNVIFAGYGSVTSYPQDPKRIMISPQAVNRPAATKAALVVSRQSFPSTDLDYQATLTTNEQLRRSSPSNPWEVGWVIWDYQDNSHFYYAIAKPNGWELGKRDPAYPGGQRFLATGNSPKIAIAQQTTIGISRSTPTAQASELTLRINGVMVSHVIDTERPYRSGSVGIYCEDSTVTYTNLTVSGAALLT